MKPDNERHRPSVPETITLSVEAAFELAFKLHQGGDLDEAEMLYRRIVEKAPDHLNALHFYALLCHHQQRRDEAAGLIGRIIAIDPENADAHNNLGNVLDGLGRVADAEACYRKAVALNPDHAPALNNLGVMLMARKAVTQALDVYRRAVGLAPEIANFRYNLANALRKCDRVQDALAAYRTAVDLDPTHVGAWQGLSRTLVDAGRGDEAAHVFDEWLEKDPRNPIAHYQKAACTGQGAPERAPDAYVQKTFDDMAGRFDAHMQANLDYRAPQLLIAALAEILPPPDASLDVLDAGCGTGLCGPLIRPYARNLVGVDLSSGMLARAKGSDVYDELVQAELTEYINAQADAYDLILSADTLCYFGDIQAILKGAAGALRNGGVLAFTLEDNGGGGEGWQLNRHGRYAHDQAYVGCVLAAIGFTVRRIDSVNLRNEGGLPVAGHLVVATSTPEMGDRRHHGEFA